MDSEENRRYYETIGTISKVEMYFDDWLYTKKNRPEILFCITFTYTSEQPCFNGCKMETLQSWSVANSEYSEEEYKQLCRLGQLVNTNNPDNFVGKKVKFIFIRSCYLGCDTLVGIGKVGKKEYDKFIIPYYLFPSELKRMCKKPFNNKDEVIEVIEELIRHSRPNV